MQIIESTYNQEVPTIHPDLIIKVPFRYIARVYQDEGETVEVIEAWINDLGENKILPIHKKTPSVERFLAHIREHARAKAYKQRKQNNIQSHEQTSH
jgi:hypothetical protein